MLKINCKMKVSSAHNHLPASSPGKRWRCHAEPPPIIHSNCYTVSIRPVDCSLQYKLIVAINSNNYF